MARKHKKSRKFLGQRTWGAGNKKNRRGAGIRGGVGNAGRKHKSIHMILYGSQPEKGFARPNQKKLKEINLSKISSLIVEKNEPKPTIDLAGYKVLGDGKISAPAIIKADRFTKRAAERIKSAGGEAVQL
ncbi:MAG: uL15m family ribosomal protein [Candidatus Micrarchaeia archaeon]